MLIDPPDFRDLFQGLPGMYLVLSPDLIILAATDEYLRTTMTTREQVVGHGLFEIFPDNPDDPAASGEGNLRSSLQRVIETKTADMMAVQKYDIRRPEAEGGGFEERFWSPTNSPVLTTDRELRYIVHRAEDVTEFIRVKQAGIAHRLLSEEMRSRADRMEADVYQRAQEIQDRHRELRRAHEELAAARDAALEASRLKSEFLANVSHEIRTPLNGIIGLIDLTLDTLLTERQREFLTMARTSSEALAEIINDLLDMSKIEAGRFELDRGPFQLTESLESAIAALGIRADQKGLELACRFDPAIPDQLIGDASRLRQIIINLVGNAIKFTEKGEVVIDVRSVPGSLDGRAALEFEVRDTGIGIPPEKQAIIFDSFRQADNSMTRRFGGTGLGLAISSKLVEMMGGRLKVQSQVNEGSQFSFGVEFEIDARQGATRKDTGELRNRSVLVVDDNPTSRTILQELLQSWGMRPVVADSGAAALRISEAAASSGTGFDLVVTDLSMPDLSGFELVAALRRQPIYASTHVIMLASSTTMGDASTAKDLGVSARLTKPIRRSALLNAILRTLGVSVVQDDAVDITSSRAPQRQVPLNLLLVEDTLVNRVALGGLLEQLGHSVTEAHDGAQALELLATRNFDAVLMDVQMPVMDGLEATRRIRAADSTACNPSIPILAMTAHAMTGDRERCLNAGMNGYVSKPIRRVALLDELARVVGTPWAPTREAVAPGASVVPFDIAAVTERLGGDRKLLGEVVQACLDSAPELLRTLRSACASDDLATMADIGHRFKSILGLLGCPAMSTTAARLEAAGRDHRLDDARSHVDLLEAGLVDFLAALEAFNKDGETAENPVRGR